jgi:hypothetical protein
VSHRVTINPDCVGRLRTTLCDTNNRVNRPLGTRMYFDRYVVRNMGKGVFQVHSLEKATFHDLGSIKSATSAAIELPKSKLATCVVKCCKNLQRHG